MALDELFHFSSSSPEHGRDLFFAEFSVDLEVRFSVISDLFHLLDRHILYEENRLLIPFSEGSQLVYLLQCRIIPFVLVDLGVDFHGFDEIIFGDACFAVSMEFLYQCI